MGVEDQREEGRLSGDVKVLVRLEEIVRDHEHRRVRRDREQRERGRHADRPRDRRGDGRLHGREGDEEGGRRVAVVHLRRVRILLQSVEEGGRLADRGVRRRRRLRGDEARLHREPPRQLLHRVEGRVEPIGSLLPPQRRAAVRDRFQRRERRLVRAVTTADEAGGAAVEGERGGGDARDQQLVVVGDGGGAGG